MIELMVAMAMISVVIATIFYFMLSSTKLVSRAIDFSKSDQTVRSVAARISSDIIQSGGAGVGSGPDKLILGNISYQFLNNKVRREEGNDVYYLTIEGEINGLKFSYPSSKLIKFEIIPNYGGVYYLNAYARN